mmetsp:Transcript_55380/g.165970  ORF Transcript_55380/g.165970 Transcript_55380/m.165970 type:complete len:262 (+) Transcript_55380:759-1544(+)
MDEGGEAHVPPVASSPDGDSVRIEEETKAAMVAVAVAIAAVVVVVARRTPPCLPLLLPLRIDPFQQCADIFHAILALFAVVQLNERLAVTGRPSHVRIDHADVPFRYQVLIERVESRTVLSLRSSVRMYHHGEQVRARPIFVRVPLPSAFALLLLLRWLRVGVGGGADTPAAHRAVRTVHEGGDRQPVEAPVPHEARFDECVPTQPSRLRARPGDRDWIDGLGFGFGFGRRRRGGGGKIAHVHVRRSVGREEGEAEMASGE